MIGGTARLATNPANPALRGNDRAKAPIEGTTRPGQPHLTGKKGRSKIRKTMLLRDKHPGNKKHDARSRRAS